MRASLVVALLPMLAGCTVTPAPQAPDTTGELIPTTWIEDAPAAAMAAATSAESISAIWWHGFADPRLTQLIEIAMESNRDLDSAAARLDAAVAQARIAGAALKPQAGVSVSGSRRRQNFIGLPIPGAEGGVLSNTSTNVGADLNVSWEVDLWGRLRAGRSAAENRAEAALFDLADARQSIAAQTAKAWFAYLEAKSQVELAAQTLGNRERVRTRIERRYRSGLRTPFELRFAVANEANSAAALAARRRLLDLTRRQIEVLVARDPAALALLDETAVTASNLPTLPPQPKSDLPAETLRRRPDLRASERRLAAAGLDVAAARRLLYPQLTLTGSAGRSSNQLEDLVDNDFSIWSLAVGILQPLFQGGRLRAGVDLAGANRLDLLARHEGAVVRAVSDVQSQLAAGGYLSEQHSALSTAADASAAAREIAQDRYFAGLTDYLEVLAAEASATTASSQLLDIERQRLDQRIDLYLALGAGQPMPSPATRDSNAEDQT